MKYLDKIGFKVFNQETFEKAMQIINPKIKILSSYISSSTPVEFLCECGEIHHKSPNNLLNGSRCRKFIGCNTPKKKDEFLQKLNEINNKIIMLDEYVDANTKIKFKCSCGREFYKTPSQMIHSNPLCPKCANNRLTVTEAKEKIKLINPNVEIKLCDSDDFISKRLKVECVCTCGYNWESTIERLLSGQGCTICNRKRISHDEYIDRINKLNKDIIILSQYKTLEDDIVYRCKCGNIHTKNARLLLRCPSCPNCATNTRKTTEQFVCEMKSVNSKIVILGEYINAETPIEYICECGKKHKSSPSLLLQGYRCGHCNMSKPEQNFADSLLEHNIEYTYDYKIDGCVNKNMLKFDFWLPKYKVLIEIDGEHHYKPVNFRGISDEQAQLRHKYCVEMDKIKNEYCLLNDITLIRIPYWNFTKEYFNKVICEEIEIRKEK